MRQSWFPLKAIESATILFYNIGNMEAEAVINALGALAQETRLAIFHDLEGYWEKWVNGGR
jgi:hypothetical protein